MNNNENNVGGSSNGQENGDAKPKQDRPLKKARFAWQVKGKHHLKKDSNANNKNDSSKARVDSRVKDWVPRETLFPPTRMSINFTPFDCITDFNTVKDIEEAKAECLGEFNDCDDLNYDRNYACRLCTHPIDSQNNTSNIKIPATKKRNFKDELPLQEWQSIQESRCLLDNLVNKVLDTWTSNPLLGDYGLDRGVANLVNNEGNNEVVNEGILMAISAHGLQNAPDSEETSTTDTPTPNTVQEVIPTTSSSYTEGSHSSTSNVQNEAEQSSTNCLQEEDYVTDNNSSVDDDLCDNILANDFLDAAVEFAIQNKGLTSSATEFG